MDLHIFATIDRQDAIDEFGLNESKDHLREDIRRLCHKRANIEQGFVLHLYRLSNSGDRVSGRDWSSRSPQILSVEQVAGILADEQAAETAADREIEILYAVTGETGKYETGVWLIRRGETSRLV